MIPDRQHSPAFRATLMLLTATALLAACGDGDGPSGPPPMAVTVVVAKSAPVLLSDTLPGRVVAYRNAEVRPQVDGLIDRRLFDEGATVEAGQQLFQINPKSYEATLHAAEAQLASAEATNALAHKRLARNEQLLKSQAASRQTYDDAVAAAAESAAAVQVARAQVQVATINVTYTQVTAPISGLIGRSAVSEGALVTASQPTPLATITQLDPIYVDLTQSSVKIIDLRQKIASGHLQNTDEMPVTLVLDGAGRTYAHEGKLQFSEVIVDQGTDSITLRVVFPNPDKILLPGMFVRAEVSQGRMENGFLTPQKAILRAPTGDAFVWIATPENTVARRSVTLDRAMGSDWLVQSGLNDGDKVIVEGMLKIQDGMPVTPQILGENAGAPPATAPAAAEKP